MRKWLLSLVEKGIINASFTGQGSKTKLRDELSKEFFFKVKKQYPRLARDRWLEIAEKAADAAIRRKDLVQEIDSGWGTRKRG
jgi:hypothetical protein